MWHHIGIFLPWLGAGLDLAKWLFTPLGRILVLAVFILGLVTVIRRSGFAFKPQFAKSAVLSMIGALLTFLLSTQLNWGAVVASAVVGLAGARVLKGRDQVVFYLGAFVGMSSALRFPTYAPLVVAGLLGGFLFELLDESWPGVGGRLGTIAAAAVLVVLVVTGGA